MTEQSNAELIVTAKAMREQLGDDYPKPGSILDLWFKTVDALEAAERRAGELAAVVEKAEDYLTRHYLGMRVADAVLPILATAPDDALREHDEELIERLANELNEIRNEPGLVHLAVRYEEGYYTGLRSGIESSEALLREKVRQRQEGKS